MAGDDPLEYCWLDVNSYTKADWEEIHSLSEQLKSQGYFASNDFKRTVAAVALFVDAGQGYRVPEQ